MRPGGSRPKRSRRTVGDSQNKTKKASRGRGETKMEKTRVVLKNKGAVEKVASLIDQAQKHCRERLIDPVGAVHTAQIAYDRAVELVGSKKGAEGAWVDVDMNAQDFPKAYRKKGTPKSTVFTVHVTNRGPVIGHVSRDYCGKHCYTFIFSDKQKKAIAETAIDNKR